MRRRAMWLVIFGVVALRNGPACRGGDTPALKPPADTGPTVAQAVEEAVRAHAAGDATTLARIASRARPDPWLVADDLRRAGALEAAVALAKVGKGPATQGLLAYLQQAAPAADEAARTAALESLPSLRSEKKFDVILARVDLFPDAPRDVAWLRAQSWRAQALAELERPEEASHVYEAAAAEASRLGWVRRRALMESLGGDAAHRAGDLGRARSLWAAARVDHESLGERGLAAKCLQSLGADGAARESWAEAAEAFTALAVHRRELGQVGPAREAAEQALAYRVRAPDPRQDAFLHAVHGSILARQGKTREAIAELDAAAKAQTDLGDTGRLASTRLHLAKAQRAAGDPAAARREAEAARELYEKAQDRANVADAWRVVGQAFLDESRPQDAVPALRRALELRGERDDLRWSGNVLVDLGGALHLTRHDLEARPVLERARAIAVEIADASLESIALQNLAVYVEREEGPAARLALERRLLEVAEAASEADGALHSLVQITRLLVALERLPEALQAVERARAILRAPGGNLTERERASNEGWIEQRAALVHERLDDLAEAYACAGRAAAAWERAGDLGGVARGLVGRAGLERKLGKADAAVASYERALDLARRLDAVEVQRSALSGLALVYASQGRHAEALARALESLALLRPLRAGRADAVAVEVQGLGSAAYGVGVQAAVALGDAEALLRVIELGRAGAMRDALSVADPASQPAPSESMRKAEEVAREAEASARRELAAALQRGDEQAHLAARERLGEARRVRSRLFAERLTRAKLAAPTGSGFEAAPEAIRASLRAEEALVYFERVDDQGIALVVRRDGVRLVRLGKLPEEWIEVYSMAARLREVLVTPLALPKDVRCVLVSPVGKWADLPIGLLWPDLDVALVPSGTILTWLRARSMPAGEGVLALGDPVYKAVDPSSGLARLRGENLTPLPGTGEEARAVGTEHLLGANATRPRLRQSLAAHRWRAAHIACHCFLVGSEGGEPELVLTPTPEDDGRVTGQDFLWGGMPADVVVLSACHSGEGRVASVEGVLGLPRALLLGGARSVVVGLGRVDDVGTTTFMRAFHAKLKSGMGPSRALREARQSFPREASSDPDLAARWVVWGLPE